MLSPPSASLTIRPARADDLAAIAEIQRASIHVLGAAAYGRTEAEAWARFGIEASRDLLSQGQFFVGEMAGRVLGVSGWSADVERRDAAWVRYVFVHPDAAGRGLGRQLVAASEASAIAAGRPGLNLWSSLNAVGFYRRLGYRQIRRAHWPVERGIELEYVLMTKRATLRRAAP